MKLVHTLLLAVMMLGTTATSALAQKKYGPGVIRTDDFGKDYLKGLKDGLGAKAAGMIVAEATSEAREERRGGQAYTF
jgi:hypothetical protein